MTTETKRFRRLISILLIFIFATFIAQMDVFAAKSESSLDAKELPVGGWTPPEVHELEEDVDVVNPSENQPSKRNLLKSNSDLAFDKGFSTVGYNALKKNAQKTFYDDIDDAVKNFLETSPTIQTETWDNETVYPVADLDYKTRGLTKNEAWQSLIAYDYDHPAYYWINSNSFWSSSSNIYLTTYEEYAAPSERARINELVSSGVNEYVSLAAKGEDTLDKIAIVHDKMVSEVDYAWNSDDEPEKAKWAHSVQGVFDPTLKYVVCEGYADAFSLIMNCLGIHNYYIVGIAGSYYEGSDSDQALGGHAWNAVSDDDGKTYMYMDLTWDDDDEDEGYDYLYFGMPKSDFELSTKEKTVIVSGIPQKKTVITEHRAYTSSSTGFSWLYDLPEIINDSPEGSYYYRGGYYYDGNDAASASNFAETIKIRAARAGDCVSVLSSNVTARQAINNALGISGYYTGKYNNKTYYYGLKKISASEIDISSAVVNTEKTEYTYKGRAIEPEVEVTLNGVKLLEGENYSVSYANNNEPGTAGITVTGAGNYYGSASAEFTINEDTGGGDSDEPTVLAFTSDVHNDQGNYLGQTRLGIWIDNIRSRYGRIDAMAFGGDMAQYNSADTRFWSETQRVMDLVAAKGVTAYYTTGNHEYDHDSSITDDFYPDKNETTRKYIQNDWAVSDDEHNYRIYCLGVGEANISYSYVNNAYTANQVTTLRDKLAAVDNSKPIFIITHFPLHYNGSRTISKASDVIDTLNNAAIGKPDDPSDDKKIVFLWGHNHSMDNPNDDHYDGIYQKGSDLQYDSSNTKKIQFIYAAAGCMSDTEKDPGSGNVKGKGLVVTINNDDLLSFAYHDADGLNVTEGGRYNEDGPVPVDEVNISEALGSDEDGLTVEVGKTIKLYARISPIYATDDAVTWSSSDESVATVSNIGEVKGVAEGTTVITAKVADSISGEEYTANVDVTVVPRSGNEPVYVLTDQIKAGKKYIITSNKTGDAYVLTNNNGSISSSKVSVEDGKIYAESEAVIFTATGSGDTVNGFSNEGRYITPGYNSLSLTTTSPSNQSWSYSTDSKLTCKAGNFTYNLYFNTSGNNFTSTMTNWGSGGGAVYLFEEVIAVDSISLDKPSADITEGETLQLTVTVLPEDATNKAVTWRSDDTSVATVDQNGLVTAVGQGTATITATSKDNGQMYAECVVTVVPTVSHTVTFKVANGKWNDNTSADKTVTLSGREGTDLKLTQAQIPAAGNRPSAGYKAGSWDAAPDTTTAITADTTYTYRYERKPSPVITKEPTAKTLTYNGSQQELITGGEVTGGTMYYAVTQGSSTPTASTNWSTSVPKEKNAGSYNVYYKVIGDPDYLDINTDPDNVVGASISKATLSITAHNKEKKYGEDDPPLTYTPAGLMGSDSLSGSLQRAAGKNVGTYAVSQGSLTAGSNYEISFTGATFTISKAPLTVSAEGYNGEKDGAYYSIAITLKTTTLESPSPSDATIYYSTDKELNADNCTDGTTNNPKKKDTGKYTVYYYVDSKNYNPTPASGSATINIYDKTALRSAVSAAESYYNSIKNDYTAIANDLKTELNKAKVLADKSDAEQNEIDAEVTSLNAAITTAKADRLEADKTTFNNYKTDQIGVVNGKARTGDSAASAALIAGALSDINALQYNTNKTLAQNKAAVDTIVSELSSALETQRAADAKEADDTAAAAAVTKSIAALPQANSVTLDDKDDIEAAREAYENLTDDQKNKVALETLQKLADAETALQAAEEAARLVEFNTYKSNKITTVEGMAEEGDSDASKALITKAKSDINALGYDSTKTLDQNKAAVDDIVSKLETDLAAQRVHDANVTTFNNYKTDQIGVVNGKALPGDSAASAALITGAVANIESLPYDSDKTLEENKAAVDDIVSTLVTELNAQRDYDDKVDAFNSYKTAQTGIVDRMATEGDSEAITALITKAKSDISSLEYDQYKTLDENKAAVDSIVSDLMTALASQVVVDAVTESIDSLPDSITLADREAIEAARAAYEALPDEQKGKVSSDIVQKLEAAEAALQAAEAAQLEADTATFNSYKKDSLSVVAGMVKDGDSAASAALITKAKSDIISLEYDSTRTPEENKAAIDSIVSKLETDLATQRAADKKEAAAADEEARIAAERANAAKYTPGKVKLTSAKVSGKNKVTVKFKKLSANVTGYEIRLMDKKTKVAKTVPVGKSNKKTIKKIVKKLKKNRKYRVTVRAYNTVGGKTYYGAWSNAKSIKTRK